MELTKKLGWTKPPICLEVEPEAEEKAKLMLVGKILSSKIFSCRVVKEIIDIAWTTVKDVEVTALDKNVFFVLFQP